MILHLVRQRTYFNLLIAFFIKRETTFPISQSDYMHNQKVNT